MPNEVRPKVLNTYRIDLGAMSVADRDNMVFVGRPTKWGNPFYIGKHGNREEVIQLYREWLPKQIELMKDLHELRCKDLVCFCEPLACHADVLLELAND